MEEVGFEASVRCLDFRDFMYYVKYATYIRFRLEIVINKPNLSKLDKFDNERWRNNWENLFDTYYLILNNRL
jgi:hypothetical protein